MRWLTGRLTGTGARAALLAATRRRRRPGRGRHSRAVPGERALSPHWRW
ncbi:MAG: hypothetical protein MZV65_36375 [Chromatiales bacterium]|nr:hypothetical protein [Chromatiales bacterium]